MANNFGETLLQTPVKEVATRYQVALFDYFCKHFGLQEKGRTEAWESFEQLREMDMTLNLALTCAVTFGSWKDR